MIVNDPAADPDSVGKPEGHPPITSFLGVPLREAGRSVGMIALANSPKGYRSAHRADAELHHLIGSNGVDPSTHQISARDHPCQQCHGNGRLGGVRSGLSIGVADKGRIHGIVTPPLSTPDGPSQYSAGPQRPQSMGEFGVRSSEFGVGRMGRAVTERARHARPLVER